MSRALHDTQGNRVSNRVYIRTYGSFIIVSIQLTTIFPATKGRRGEYEVSRDCQKADYTKGYDGCVYACTCMCVPFGRAHIHTYIHRHAGTERTRQSRIPIAPSRYEASCGAATIKAPVTHCSCSGQ